MNAFHDFVKFTVYVNCIFQEGFLGFGDDS